jgi:glutamine amidotransferase
MMTPVVVLDYGIGNLLNVCRALEYAGATVTVIKQANEASISIDRLVLPGVGAFGDGMEEMKKRGLDDLVKRFVETEKPFLGICVGLQMLFNSSQEMGMHKGLDILDGQVRAVPAVGASGLKHCIPHIGWRRLHARKSFVGTALEGLNEEDRFYFVHSYAAVPTFEEDCLAEVDYNGVRLCAAVQRDNILGCQFHPERSAKQGLGILQHFLSV